MIGIFVAIGWEEGPWVPLGITGCVALVMAVSLWRSRGDRKLLQTDPAAGRRALNVRAARAGTLMARLIAVWVFCTILFVVVLLAFRS
jgi:hypothetical protein